MIIVDSSVWVDYLKLHENEHTFWLQERIGRDAIGLTDLILMEVLQGVRRDDRFLKIRDQLTRCEVFDTGGKQLAIAAAMNYRLLRARGFTVRKTIDCLIASFCISKGHTLLHRDRDFDVFEHHLGLKVVHPVRH